MKTKVKVFDRRHLQRRDINANPAHALKVYDNLKSEFGSVRLEDLSNRLVAMKHAPHEFTADGRLLLS